MGAAAPIFVFAPSEILMDNLEQQITDLETAYDQQKRLTGKVLRMLIGMLEIESPEASEGLNDNKGDSLADLQEVVGSLESVYRNFTLERERLALDLRESVQSWIRQLRKDCPDQVERLDALESDLAYSCESLSCFSTLVVALVDIQRTSIADVTYNLSSQAPALPGEALLSLRRLLELLPLNDSGRTRAEQLSVSFDQDMSAQQLVGCLDEVVGLLETRENQRADEVANFLSSLSTQLAKLQTELVESRQENITLDRQESDQTQQMTDELSEMHLGLSNATSLADLKQTLAAQLSQLTAHLRRFKESRQQRVDQMQSRYDSLAQQLASVESEASAAQAVIESEREKALTDHLTGLPNRRAYEQHVKAEGYRFVRYGTHFSIVVIDIDHFKQLNDTLGHLVGDRALVLVSKVLAKQLRQSDMMARYGGEEFVAVLANTELKQAKAVAEKLRAVIEKAPFKYSGKLVDIRVSLGVTQMADGDTIDSLFERADKALYRAKQAGRNRVEVG